MFRAVSDIAGNMRQFEFAGTALNAFPNVRIVNDLKRINDKYVMGLHNNGNEVYYALSDTIDGHFSASGSLFAHRGDDDLHIVSIGFVVDATRDSGDRLLGALYGAGPNSDLAHNSIYAAWMQKRVVFASSDKSNISDTLAIGPFDAKVPIGATSSTGVFRVFDESGDTLLFESGEVSVAEGDVWRLR